MAKIGDVLRSGDWKSEKHVPVIQAPDAVEADKVFTVNVSVGEDIPHPNTTEHHIRWIKLLFQPDEGFTYEVADWQFTAHGESVKGADQGPVYTEPFGTVQIRLKESGTLLALSYCNIHGLWESAKKIEVRRG
ncbi:MAG: Neelaredoxin [Firmicutes bacterium]|nr:Neelaredoxin [Bacillota bacterium]